jgi:hypothetical protein
MNRTAFLVCALAALVSPTPARPSLSSPDWDESVTLKFACGGQVEGRYRGLVGAIPAAKYPGRYDAWRSGLGLAAAPALGDSVLVFLRSTVPKRGVCRGFANGALLFGHADRCADLVLPLGAIDAVMRLDPSAPDSGWTGVRQLWKHAPSLCVVAVKVGDSTLAAPPTMIAATVRHHDPRGDVAGGLILGVLVGGLLAASAVAAAYASAFSHGLI